MLSREKSLVGTSLSNIEATMGISMGNKQFCMQSSLTNNYGIVNIILYFLPENRFCRVHPEAHNSSHARRQANTPISKKGGTIERPFKRTRKRDHHAIDIAVTGQLSTAC